MNNVLVAVARNLKNVTENKNKEKTEWSLVQFFFLFFHSQLDV